MTCSSPSNTASRVRGFTLIELLVAMLIFAVLGTAAYQGLFQVQRVRDGVAKQSDDLGRMQRAFYWMADDIAQIVDRPVRSALGSTLPALVISEQGESLLEFTRAGWANPAGDVLPPRSNLQRVAYTLDGDRLLRRYWYHLDNADDEGTRRRLLLDKITNFQMRFLDTGAEWHDSWPPANANLEGDVGLPAAVEFKIELEDTWNVTRLFALPG